MNKFENVDVLASLQQIMQQNTAAFQNDFDIDWPGRSACRTASGGAVGLRHRVAGNEPGV